MGYVCLLLAIVLLGLSVYYVNKFDPSEMEKNEKNAIVLFMVFDVCYGLFIVYNVISLLFLILGAILLVYWAFKLFNKHNNHTHIEV